MKKIYVAAAIVFAALSLSACIPETTSTKVLIEPDFEAVEEVSLDFTVLHNDVIEAFGDFWATPYVFVTDLDIDGNNEKKLITVNGTVIEGTDQNDCDIFTIRLLRYINDAAADQFPFNIEISDSTWFGSLYDTYSFEITLTDETDGSVIFSYKQQAGDDIEYNPDIESYEEEFKEYRELANDGIEDQEDEE